MSLMTLVSEAVEERRPSDPVAPGFRDAEPQSVVVDENGVPLPRTPPLLAPGQRAKARAAAPAGAIEALVRFFPAEVMLLYIPGVAMMQSHFKNDSARPLLLFYLAWTLATPLLIWLVFDGELKKAGFGLADRIPLRQMVLGFVSFAAWGACVPGVFPEQQWFLGWLALVVATLLPKIDKKLNVAK